MFSGRYDCRIGKFFSPPDNTVQTQSHTLNKDVSVWLKQHCWGTGSFTWAQFHIHQFFISNIVSICVDKYFLSIQQPQCTNTKCNFFFVQQKFKYLFHLCYHIQQDTFWSKIWKLYYWNCSHIRDFRSLCCQICVQLKVAVLISDFTTDHRTFHSTGSLGLGWSWETWFSTLETKALEKHLLQIQGVFFLFKQMLLIQNHSVQSKNQTQMIKQIWECKTPKIILLKKQKNKKKTFRKINCQAQKSLLQTQLLHRVITVLGCCFVFVSGHT